MLPWFDFRVSACVVLAWPTSPTRWLFFEICLTVTLEELKEKTFLNHVCSDEDVGDAAVVVRCLCDDARVLTQAEEENPDYFMLII